MNVRIAAIATLLLTACAPHPIKTAADDTPAHCIKETGSRIAPGKGGCLNAAGRSYTREELERSGHSSTGDALRHSLP